jgi:hypothetical protein
MIRPLLLHLANSGYPSQRFYAIKKRLLHRHGTRVGGDVQEIVKECYGPRGGEYGDYQGCTRDARCKCRGTGVFSRRIFGLERWRWGRFTFHVPTDTLPAALITIRGRIAHRHYGRLSKEATLWLYLLCGEMRLFWQEFTGSCSHGWYAWPLVLLQRVVTPIIWKLRRHDCIYCHKRFFTWGSGWCVCRRCRARSGSVEDAMPF